MTERMLPPGGSRMREDTRDRYLHWDQGLPRIEELTPLNQTLITPVLACAFSIKEGGMLPERTEADVERSAQATLANLYANSRLGNKSEYPAGSQYQQYAHRVDGDSRAFYGGANVHAYGGPAHGSPSYSQPYEASGPLPAYPSHRSFSRGLQEPQALSDPRYANPRYSSELRHSSDTRLAEPPPHHVDNRYSDPRKNDSRLMDPRLSNQRYPPERGTYMGGSVAGYAHARNFHERAPLTSVDPRVAHGDSRQMDPRGQLDPQDLRLHVDLRPSFESLLSPRGEGQSTGDVRPTDLRLGSEARGGERGGGGSGGGGGGGNQYGAVAELRGQESLPMQDSPQQGDVRGGGGDSCGGDAYGNGAGPAAGEPTTDSMRTGYGALERRPGMDLGDMEGSKGGTEQEGGGSGPRDGSGNQMSKKAPRKSAEADEYQEVSGGQENSNEDGQPRTLKRPRLVWTPQLHKRFVDAVGHLGIKNAVPKTIMQLMNVEGLTRENVASHLQKYRLYLKRMQGLVGLRAGPLDESWKVTAGGTMDLNATMHSSSSSSNSTSTTSNSTSSSTRTTSTSNSSILILILVTAMVVTTGSMGGMERMGMGTVMGMGGVGRRLTPCRQHTVCTVSMKVIHITAANISSCNLHHPKEWHTLATS
eukprot:jgi/Mesen1/8057/ME000043S07441